VIVDAIVVESLVKRYGRHVAVDGLDLVVPHGVVFGFLGPNGAGKTTTLRTMLDLIRPTSGRITVLGRDSRRESVAIRRTTGYVPGDLALYDRLTGAELLSYLGSLRGGFDPLLLAELVERFGVTLDRRIRQLSRGNRQKLGLVQAFAHRPALLSARRADHRS
jgi:ABC-2 type transport system ATP-binding protein